MSGYDVSSLAAGCLSLLEEENERLRREREEEELRQIEVVQAVPSVPDEDYIPPGMRGFCKWVTEQYYLALEDPEWVAAKDRYLEALRTEGEEAAEKYVPPFKVRHKKERAPAGTGTLSPKSAEKSKVKNSATNSIPQNS